MFKIISRKRNTEIKGILRVIPAYILSLHFSISMLCSLTSGAFPNRWFLTNKQVGGQDEDHVEDHLLDIS